MLPRKIPNELSDDATADVPPRLIPTITIAVPLAILAHEQVNKEIQPYRRFQSTFPIQTR